MTAIHLLNPSQYHLARSVFADLSYHLAVPAILNGDAPGAVYVDDPSFPRAGLVLYQHRLYLAGSPDNESFNRALNELIVHHYAPIEGEVYFVVYPEEGRDRTIEEQVLKDCQPKRYDREYYTLDEPLAPNDPPITEGFSLLPVTRELVQRTDLEGIAELLEELCSERDSVDAFLEKSFGTVMVTETKLVSWCLSEYNSGDRCEVGIATAQGFQKRGFATITGRAFARQAFAHGIHTIGWHCWKDNTPSGASARKIGYHLQKTYPSFVGHLEKASV